MAKINKAVELMSKMKLPVMALEYEKQLKDTSITNYSFEERLIALLSVEYDSRINHTIEKNIKKANFPISGVSFNDLNKDPKRHLNLELINSLQNNEYIKSGLNVVIVGATGTGKTWCATAYGMCACNDKCKVLYTRLPELLSQIEYNRVQNKYLNYMKNIGKFDLVIIDEFLLNDVSLLESKDVLEILEARNNKSTIFCSQFSPEGWHNKLGSGPLADAILDRIINSSYSIFLQGDSLRETYSKVRNK